MNAITLKSRNLDNYFDTLTHLIERDLDQLPQPATGNTLQRWRSLSAVAEKNLSVAKLFEAHVDALAILHELGEPVPPRHTRWGVWAAESGKVRLQLRRIGGNRVRLYGKKMWCSGAPFLTHALITAWENERGPFLISVALDQRHLRTVSDNWHALGMADTVTCEVLFEAAAGELIGEEKIYLSRAGFWHGAAGIAACWFGGAKMLADKLCAHLKNHASARTSHAFAHLGAIDIALQQSAAVLQTTAVWIDANPTAPAMTKALAARGSVEANAQIVLDRVGRVVGARPFCEDAEFARMAADLPVFLRQSHAEQDLAQLGQTIARDNITRRHGAWTL